MPPAPATRAFSESTGSCLPIDTLAFDNAGTMTSSAIATATSQSSADSQIQVSLNWATFSPFREGDSPSRKGRSTDISPNPATTTSTDAYEYTRSTRADDAVWVPSPVRMPRDAVVAAWTSGPTAKIANSRCRANSNLNTSRGYPSGRLAGVGRVRGWIGVAVLASALSGCSGGGHVGAAEPATAPVPTAHLAGSVRSIGDAPEGIVYDPKTRLLAVAVRDPARLLLLDARTLAVRRTIALPGTVRHLQLAALGGPVLVPAETANTLVEVGLPDGRVRATRVGKQPHDAAEVAHRVVVVGNEFGSSLTFLRGGRALGTARGVQQPGGVLGDGTAVVVIDVGRFTISSYAVATRKRIAVAPAGKGPTHGVRLSRGRVAVADTRGNALLVFDVRPLQQVAHLHLDGAPYGMAVDRSTDIVWVTLTAGNEVVGVDMSGASPKVIARYPTVRQPNTVAVASGSHTVWVTGTAGGQLQTITR